MTAVEEVSIQIDYGPEDWIRMVIVHRDRGENPDFFIPEDVARGMALQLAPLLEKPLKELSKGGE